MAIVRLRAWLSKLVAPRAFPPCPTTIYAVGDIHGRVDCLRRVQAAIDRDKATLPPDLRTTEVYLGDYVDRGPDSPKVLDNLIARSGKTEIVALRGNHEMLMSAFLAGTLEFESWRSLGGLETAMAYGVDPRRLQAANGVSASDLAPLVPVEHLRFLRSLQPYFLAPPYCFVHAGLRPGVPLARQNERDLAWIREEFLDYHGPFEHIVVHGHTPVDEIDFLRYRINIDTGAYVSNKLSVLRFDGRGPAILPQDER